MWERALKIMSVKQYIPAIKYGNKVGYDEVQGGVIIAETVGTAAVSVFGSSGLEFPIVIVDVKVVSLDTTAGNITVENPASTVVTTIAKGTVAGVVVGGVTIANASVAAGNNVIVKSSSAGNARVQISYISA